MFIECDPHRVFFPPSKVEMVGPWNIKLIFCGKFIPFIENDYEVHNAFDFSFRVAKIFRSFRHCRICAPLEGVLKSKYMEIIKLRVANDTKSIGTRNAHAHWIGHKSDTEGTEATLLLLHRVKNGDRPSGCRNFTPSGVDQDEQEELNTPVTVDL